MYQRRGYWFSPEERIAIVREFEKGGMTLTQIQAKYGIKGHSTVYRWRQDLQNPEKMRTFAAVFWNAVVPARNQNKIR